MLEFEERLRSTIRDVPDFPKPGIMFKDITPVLSDASLCKELADIMFLRNAHQNIDAIVGVESRGFLFGMMLSQKFNVPFVPVRKKGKLPYKTISIEYELEYGSAIVEMHDDALKPGMNVLIHDDLLATGGTAGAAAELVRMNKAMVAGFAFLIELNFLNGRKRLEKYSQNILSLTSY